MRRIELTSIALELDATDPRICVLQPIVREPAWREGGIRDTPDHIRKREWARRRRGAVAR